MDQDLVLEELALRQGLHGRIALLGPTGSGKTFTGLSIATELQGDGEVLGIDTERGTMNRYAHDRNCDPRRCTRSDHFTFARIRWDPPYDPAKLTRVLREQGNSGRWAVILIDSGSHFWRGQGGTLDVVDAAKQRRQGGNDFAAWKFGDQVQTEMVEQMLALPCHLIFTMRVKMGYEVQEDSHGRKVPVKIGLQPVQRDALEYEFDVIGELNQNHQLAITKSRCSLIADKVFLPHQERDMARTLRDWLLGGEAERPARVAMSYQEAQDRVIEALGELDTRTRRDRIVANGYDMEAKPQVSAWVRTLDVVALQRLASDLYLPLDVMPEGEVGRPSTGGEPSATEPAGKAPEQDAGIDGARAGSNGATATRADGPELAAVGVDGSPRPRPEGIPFLRAPSADEGDRMEGSRWAAKQ